LVTAFKAPIKKNAIGLGELKNNNYLVFFSVSDAHEKKE